VTVFATYSDSRAFFSFRAMTLVYGLFPVWESEIDAPSGFDGTVKLGLVQTVQDVKVLFVEGDELEVGHDAAGRDAFGKDDDTALD
jgi:hypothetical protein